MLSFLIAFFQNDAIIWFLQSAKPQISIGIETLTCIVRCDNLSELLKSVSDKMNKDEPAILEH
jgi:hypothetical protein